MAGRLAAGLFARVAGPGRAARRAQRDLESVAEQRRRFVICIPLLKLGSGERVAANLAHAFAHLYGPQSVAVLVTDGSRFAVRVAFPKDASIRAWFPPRVPVVDVGAMRRLQRYPRSLSLRIALMTMKPDLVINIDSETLWELYRRHGTQLSRHMRLATVAFVLARDSDGKPAGYAATDLRNAMKYLSVVITDNGSIIDELAWELRLWPGEGAKFVCLYQPSPCAAPPVGEGREGATRSAKRRQILWAGRVTRSRCPELLPVIARLMPECDFQAYGAREFGYRFPAVRNLLFPHDDLGNALSSAPNLFWRGSFGRFDELPVGRFDALLYTGLYDGLPNVLIEAGAQHLPIVAPNVGGIAELIYEETGWLVQNPLDAIEFADKLHACLVSDTTARTTALADLVATRHSFEAFCRAVTDLVEGARPVCA